MTAIVSDVSIRRRLVEAIVMLNSNGSIPVCGVFLMAFVMLKWR